MADFESAFKFIMENEGNYHEYEEDNGEYLLCSDCFKDEGIKLYAFKIGIVSSTLCNHCNLESGNKLTRQLIKDLCYSYFVRGTIHRTDYGGSPIVQIRTNGFNINEINTPIWLQEDVKILNTIGDIGFFLYGPRMWMIGDIEPLNLLQTIEERDNIIEEILGLYPTVELTHKDYFYRLRINPDSPNDFGEYDTAPDIYLGRNRFDNPEFPVLYGATNLELCIHECRATIEDNLYVAKLSPTHNLRLLDLTEVIEEDNLSEFESIDLAIHFLFLAGKHSYEICRRIAYKAQEKGYDGIIYPSYFSFISTGAFPFESISGISIRKFKQLKEVAKAQNIPNIAIFGRPIHEKKISIGCINKVVINKFQYDLSFGPSSF